MVQPTLGAAATVTQNGVADEWLKRPERSTRRMVYTAILTLVPKP